MGRYYPPDADNPPSFNTSHPLGHRAKKINQGILTVRFELPFAVWCTTCKPEAIIGQGVRFNAEKKKVGNYYSTPIWQFRMKHTACGGQWVIQTDPKNAEYIVIEGARKRDYGPDDVGNKEGEMWFLTEEERERRRGDAFANLEGKIEDKGQEKKNKERVEELYDQSLVWEDPYTANQKLRRNFRVQRKVLEKEDKAKGGMQEKFSFGYDIVDEVETDRVRASLVEFSGKGLGEKEIDEVSRKPLFESKEKEKVIDIAPKLKTKKLKSEILAEQRRQNLQQTLVGNTRASIDPFLTGTLRTNTKSNLGLLKRKRSGDSTPTTASSTSISSTNKGSAFGAVLEQAPSKKTTLSASLVDYESD